MKILRRILLALLVVLVACGGFYLWATFHVETVYERTRDYAAKDLPVPFPLTPEERDALNPGEDPEAVAMARAIARGEHIASSRAGCVDCHGAGLAGQRSIQIPMIMSLYAPNITSGGVTAEYSAADWDAVVRHGMRPNGRAALMPVMESTMLSDREVSDIIAYARSLPARDDVQPPTRLEPLGVVMFATGLLEFSTDEIDHKAPRAAQPPPRSDPVAFGGHLAQGCEACHRSDYAGGSIIGGDPSWPRATNLTPHESGLGSWTREQFTTAMREGVKPAGTPIHPIMPWRVFSNMTDDEINALWAFFETLPPTRARG